MNAQESSFSRKARSFSLQGLYPGRLSGRGHRSHRTRAARCWFPRPTGVGKTLIADYLIDRAILRNERIIYTAPIKALSNQKFKEFKALYGADRVGIITGDVVINPLADVAIMTTEIFRNILHQDLGRLKGITHIVFDEIHYLSDEDRGTVWEESIIFMPDGMRLLGLSATIPNAEELAAWIAEIKGHRVEVVRKATGPFPSNSTLYERHLGATDTDRRSNVPRPAEARGPRHLRPERQSTQPYRPRPACGQDGAACPVSISSSAGASARKWPTRPRRQRSFLMPPRRSGWNN